MHLRRGLWELVDTGSALVRCKSCLYAKVLWIDPVDASIEPPWDEWARIVQWFGPTGYGVPWRIFWFPATVPRLLPSKGESVGPKHINGGYCYPCNPNVIVVYRLEEATRVLIHELLHAACTDPHASLQIKEATTETWAELYLVALCSKGDIEKAKKLWKVQSQWIANQNEVLRRNYGVVSPNDYAWRYTVGKDLIFQNLHIALPKGNVTKRLSLRLTDPSLCR